MKKLFVILCCFFTVKQTVQAQVVDLYAILAFVDVVADTDEGSIVYQYNTINGQLMPSLGAVGALRTKGPWRFNYSTFFGSSTIANRNGHMQKIGTFNSGVGLSHTAFSYNKIQMESGLNFGYGIVSVNDYFYDAHYGTAFWTIEPNVQAVMRLTNFAKIRAGLGYRLALGSQEYYLPNHVLSGPSAMAGLTFGNFHF